MKQAKLIPNILGKGLTKSKRQSAAGGRMPPHPRFGNPAVAGGAVAMCGRGTGAYHRLQPQACAAPRQFFANPSHAYAKKRRSERGSILGPIGRWSRKSKNHCSQVDNGCCSSLRDNAPRAGRDDFEWGDPTFALTSGSLGGRFFLSR